MKSLNEMRKKRREWDFGSYTCPECGYSTDENGDTTVESKDECETCHPWIKWKRNGWHEETCGVCRGLGIVSAYSAFDFEGPTDCRSCNNGTVWVSPKGRHAEYPGGRFL